MTVVIAVKVFDGLVIAADSATTIPLPNGSHQVYNHANKIFPSSPEVSRGGGDLGIGFDRFSEYLDAGEGLRRRFMGTDRTP